MVVFIWVPSVCINHYLVLHKHWGKCKNQGAAGEVAQPPGEGSVSVHCVPPLSPPAQRWGDTHMTAFMEPSLMV